jgi:hypothetical protein
MFQSSSRNKRSGNLYDSIHDASFHSYALTAEANNDVFEFPSLLKRRYTFHLTLQLYKRTFSRADSLNDRA